MKALTTTYWDQAEQALLPRLDEFGITRLADTTGLDASGVSTASCTRPGTSDVIWVYSGKGRSRAQARVTAIMECLERSGSLWSVGVPWVIETPAVLARTHEVWDAERFTYRRRSAMDAGEPQVWLKATRLVAGTGSAGNGQAVMIPADVGFNGRRPSGLPRSPFILSTSNGLAAGTSLHGALEHALAEVIERDVISCAEVVASHYGYRFLALVAAQFGLPPGVLDGFVDNVDLAATVDPASLPPTARQLLAMYQAVDLDVIVKQLPNPFGLPAFAACAVQAADLTRYLACAGYAVRSSAEGAVESALLELAQTRATDLQGAREDRHELEKQRVDDVPNHHWLTTRGQIVQPFEPHDCGGGLDELLSRCAAAGLPDVAFVAFPGWPGVSVVRVVVADAETWHVTGGWSDFGPRLRHRLGRN